MSFRVSLNTSELHSDLELTETTAFVAQMTKTWFCGISDDLQFGPDNLNKLSVWTFLRLPAVPSYLVVQLDSELKRVHNTRAIQHARYMWI